MIRLEKVSKNFKKRMLTKNKKKAINTIDLTIEQGKIIGIVGSSGSGKTTLARIMMGILSPDEGKVFYKDRDIYKLSKKEMKQYHREVQLIFQNPENSLVPTQTVLDNLLAPIKIHKMFQSQAERMTAVMKIMQEVGVSEELLYRYPHQISGGEAQRIVICRALLLNPKVLILDEPTSMLDVSVQAHIMNLLRDIQKRLQLTYLFISHDLELISLFADEVVVMKDGEIIEKGITHQLMQCPRDAYTQTLINAFKIGEE